MAKTLCIACGVFRSDLEAEAKGMDIDIEYLPGGLHAEPNRLREELQSRIDSRTASYHRIVVLFGLCGRGIVGLKSRKSTLVFPRAHDCISLFLGGIEEYKKQFSHAPGTYYISAGWYEEQIQPKGRHPRSKISGTVEFPEQYLDTRDPEVLRERYGVENAEEITGFLDSWKKNYTRAVYIDTGSVEEEKYEAHAKDLAEKNAWEFVRLKGSRRLIRCCLEAAETDDSVIFVPPGHEVFHDTGRGTVASAPIGQSAGLNKNIQYTVPAIPGSDSSAVTHRIGLGIDAGGTYTDAVVFDFASDEVLAKAKAPTTKWKYSEGIMKAVEQLPPAYLPKIDLVSVSTTLVTNAVVESNRRAVGLLLMPNGDRIPEDLVHRPLELIKGRTTIGGEVVEGIDREEIVTAARKMIAQFRVEAFAVSGYGAAVNPELELAVKSVLRLETGMEVCCGHELSGTLNFSIRATTAVLNAGVMPIMDEFLAEMERAVSEAGIHAPLMMVRGDGSVMGESYAREYPVQTALSGPAASMAGAGYLTGLDDAVVVDIGGTTSDIGFLEQGHVAVRDDGARIGDWDTHVTAVDMITAGLGGDSELIFENRRWRLGPRRIAPVGSLGTAVDASLDAGGRRIADWSESTVPLQILYRTGKIPDFELSSREQAIFDALAQGPLTIWEVQERAGIGSWRLVKPGRLETRYCVQRAGLTPTDCYHAEGKIALWDPGVSARYMSIVAEAAGLREGELRDLIRRNVSDTLGERLLVGLLDTRSGSRGDHSSILFGGNARLEIRPRITIPVVGLGAPASLMLNDAVERLGGELIVPVHGEVANAVGAITSKVSVIRRAAVRATSAGDYRIDGLDGEGGHFETLDEAEERCVEALVVLIRDQGKKAGTSETRVEMSISTDLATTAEGSELFIERRCTARLTGRPDAVAAIAG